MAISFETFYKMQITDEESKRTFTLYAKNSQNVNGVPSSVNYPKKMMT